MVAAGKAQDATRPKLPPRLGKIGRHVLGQSKLFIPRVSDTSLRGKLAFAGFMMLVSGLFAALPRLDPSAPAPQSEGAAWWWGISLGLAVWLSFFLIQLCEGLPPTKTPRPLAKTTESQRSVFEATTQWHLHLDKMVLGWVSAIVIAHVALFQFISWVDGQGIETSEGRRLQALALLAAIAVILSAQASIARAKRQCHLLIASLPRRSQLGQVARRLRRTGHSDLAILHTILSLLSAIWLLGMLTLLLLAGAGP